MPESITYNMDCLEYMRTIPDKYFDLAVVDPPYGGGGADNEYKGAIVGRFGGRFEKYHYFDLPPTRCFLVWRKLTISESFTMAMAEYAWTSFNSIAKVFDFPPQGKKGDDRFHPTQKPIELYSWVFRLFAKPGDKILDTHLGSGSSRIAAYDAGLDFVGCEIDPVYFEAEEERFEKHIQQHSIFDADYGTAEQTGLWEEL